MTNRLATHDGTVILPWNFNGGLGPPSTRRASRCTSPPRIAHQADYAPPPVDAAFLHQEIASIHQVGRTRTSSCSGTAWAAWWPSRLGVLLAHRPRARRGDADDRARLADQRGAGSGLTPICEEANVCPQLGPGVYRFFADLWASMDWHDPAVSQNDTAEGSPVLFRWDAGRSAYTAADATGGRALSQLLFSCSGLLIENCNLIAPALLSPCPSLPACRGEGVHRGYRLRREGGVRRRLGR